MTEWTTPGLERRESEEFFARLDAYLAQQTAILLDNP